MIPSIELHALYRWVAGQTDEMLAGNNFILTIALEHYKPAKDTPYVLHVAQTRKRLVAEEIARRGNIEDGYVRGRPWYVGSAHVEEWCLADFSVVMPAFLRTLWPPSGAGVSIYAASSGPTSAATANPSSGRVSISELVHSWALPPSPSSPPPRTPDEYQHIYDADTSSLPTFSWMEIPERASQHAVSAAARYYEMLRRSTPGDTSSLFCNIRGELAEGAARARAGRIQRLEAMVKHLAQFPLTTKEWEWSQAAHTWLYYKVKCLRGLRDVEGGREYLVEWQPSEAGFQPAQSWVPNEILGFDMMAD